MRLIRSLTKTLPVALVAALAGQASAATMTTTIPVSAAASTPLVDSLNFSVAIPQFNPSLGTLTGVNLSISLNSGIDVYDVPFFFFTPGNSFSVLLTGTTQYLYQPSSSISTVDMTAAVDLNSPSPYKTVPYTGIVPASGSQVYVDTYFIPLAGSFDVNSGDVSSFVGTGTTAVPYNVTTDGSLSWYNNSNGWLDTNPGAQSGTETITYTYTAPVPEPASLGLIAIGAPLLMRRRRSN